MRLFRLRGQLNLCGDVWGDKWPFSKDYPNNYAKIQKVGSDELSVIRVLEYLFIFKQMLTYL